MRLDFTASIANAAIRVAICVAFAHGAAAATSEPTSEEIDSAPCMAALASGDDDRIIAACNALIETDKAARGERVKALIARSAAYERKGEIDRAIGDDDMALRLDPSLADLFNSRGELYRKKGDRVHALSDFGNAVKLDPHHAAARANYKSLSLEIERIGALIAVNNKPSFNCAAARRPVEKAICANPELANLDREINAVNTTVVRQAAQGNPRAGRALQREQEAFVKRRSAEFGRAGYDLKQAMRDRLDHLMALTKP